MTKYLVPATLFAALTLFVPQSLAQHGDAKKVDFPFKENDRVAWVGSSSTNIGVWPKTMQFLLATRHPELKLTFGRFTTGGGTFATGLQNMDKWLTPFKPTVVFLNYGGNDAGAGEKGLPQFKKNIVDSVAKAQGFGARVYLMTPQAADVRKAGEVPASRRTQYAEAMIAFGKEKGWPVVDIYHPLADLQTKGQKDDDAYTILTDTIHLTSPAYIAWGYYQFDALNPAPPESSASLTAEGRVAGTKRCRIEGIQATDTGLTFTRADDILPVLPPLALPPRRHVPLERLSPYLLQISGLTAGDYAITCEGKALGSASAKALGAGVNLNSIILDAGAKSPWEAVARDWWDGKNLEQIGHTRWSFDVRRK